MLQENVNFLLKYKRDLLEQIRKNEEQLSNSDMVTVLETKIGSPTLQITKNGSSNFIHSKYDPLKEADALISQYEKQVENYNHILFYGIGMGYHVEEMMKRYPDKAFSIYEPIPEVFYQYVSYRGLDNLPVNQLKYISVQWSEEFGYDFIHHFAIETSEDVLLVVLPSYERIFSVEYNFFKTTFKDKFQQKKISIGADLVFSKRWTLNALMNLPHTIKSPNLLTEKKDIFKGKPVLLVAAGPSLEDEIENLRHIKNNKLAYIIAVGSANRALVANNILPDAVCTYDPQGGNGGVFKEMIEEGYDKDVPMIYGTTVGFETLDLYKGPKLFVLTSQDTISPYFLGCENKAVPIVDDSFSIAIVTLQILSLLEVGQVILVGQNFAFRNNKFYSKGISYGDARTTEVQEKDLIDKLYVPDVNGNQIRTNQSFNQMRLLMERYIEIYDNINVINTTKDGAAIKGAPFIPLDEIIAKDLTMPLVEDNWYEWHENKEVEINEQINVFKKDILHYKKILQAFDSSINAIEKGINKGKLQNAPRLYKDFENNYEKLFNHKVFHKILNPVLRLETSLFERKLKEVVEGKHDPKVQANMLVNLSSQYVRVCKSYLEDYKSLMQSKVFPKLQAKNLKYYSSLQFKDIFKTTGQWKDIKEPIMNHSKELSHIRTESLSSKKKGSSLEFNFLGNTISIITSTRKDFASNIKVSIDGQGYFFSSKDTQTSSNESPIYQQKVFEKLGLEDKIHNVKIELLEDKKFVFEGLVINKNGSLLHVDEVIKPEDLTLGKRIRYHYDGERKEFSKLGEESQLFLPYYLEGNRKGSFYLVMINLDKEGQPELIPDRDINEENTELCIYKIHGKQVIQTELLAKSDFILSGRKKYQHNCGAIKYTGAWERKTHFEVVSNYLRENPYRIMYTETRTNGDKLSFRFKGNILRVKGKFPLPNEFNIKIDNKEVDIDIYHYKEDLIEINGLNNELHGVEIELTTNKYLGINYIEISEDGRTYHPDEVTSVEQLEVGKKIRCHYKARYNEVGEFSGLGEETNGFIPPESSAYPNGDFYLIMVDRDEMGRVVLITDRNIQNNISWDNLNESSLICGREMQIKEVFIKTRLLTGGVAYADKDGGITSPDNLGYGAFPLNNEWSRYIEFTHENGEDLDFVWNWSFVASWCQETPAENVSFRWADNINIEESTVNKRVRVGRTEIGFRGITNSNIKTRTIGFRPLFLIRNNELE